MFELLFLLSIILIISSQFLPAAEAEKEPTHYQKKKKISGDTGHQKTKPHRKNTGRAKTDKFKAINY